jgi:hypothetical protein
LENIQLTLFFNYSTLSILHHHFFIMRFQITFFVLVALFCISISLSTGVFAQRGLTVNGNGATIGGNNGGATIGNGGASASNGESTTMISATSTPATIVTITSTATMGTSTPTTTIISSDGIQSIQMSNVFEHYASLFVAFVLVVYMAY